MRAKLLLLSSAVCAGVLASQSAPPPIPVELRARFGFVGPQIVKIGEGIGNLQIADVDGDGAQEIVVADPRRARLVKLRHKGGEFTTETIPTDGQIAGYAIADVDRDGKPDLLLVDSHGRLHVKLRGGAEAGPGIDLGLGGRGIVLLTGDLDGDGAADVVAVSPSGLRWITGLAATPRLSPIEALEPNAHDFLLADLDGDNKPDLACVVPGPGMALRLRLGRGDGTFGPWLLCNTDGLRRVFAARRRGGATALATVEGPQRRVALHEFVADGAVAALQWWALGDNQAAAGKAMPFVLGDFDGDGAEDLVLAQGDKARLLFFLWHGGTFVPKVAPSLAGVTSLAAGDLDGDGLTDLVLVSPEEDALAWHRGGTPLDAFPERLPCSDKPVAVTVDADGSVLVIARNDKREAHVDRVRPGQPLQRLVELGRLPADPCRLISAEIGGAPGRQLAFVVPGEGLRIVNLQPAADDKPVKASGDVAGFTKKIDDGALALTEWQGRPALQVVRDRFVRLFRSDDNGQLQVLGQDNGPEGIAELSLAALLPDHSRLYLDKKNNKLLRARPGEAATSIDVPPFEFSHLVAHGDAALLLGPRGVLRVPFGRGPSLRPLAVHEPPTTHTAYGFGISGDFDGDGVDDLAVLDGRLPGVQILTLVNGALVRALAMPVFEAPPSDEPSDEPRELAAGDLDGDGRTDLVLLVHDRVLIYLQEK
jgi:hypothetical protein